MCKHDVCTVANKGGKDAAIKRQHGQPAGEEKGGASTMLAGLPQKRGKDAAQQKADHGLKFLSAFLKSPLFLGLSERSELRPPNGFPLSFV